VANVGSAGAGPKSAVAVEGHPDDVELSCLGTLLGLRDEGWRITIVSVTDGCNGATHDPTMTGEAIARVRYEEASEVARALGGEFRVLGAMDGYAYDTPELRRKLTSVLREVKADVVFAPPPIDYHYDHITASELAFTSVYYAKTDLTEVGGDNGSPLAPLDRVPALYYYDSNAGIEFTPSFYVDITRHIAEKRELVEKHRSQMVNMHKIGGWSLTDYVEIVGRFRGLQGGTEYAEGFQSCLRWPRNPALQRFPV
jgi:LmbE family N-acetylglucosaminyl deacetylase